MKLENVLMIGCLALALVSACGGAKNDDLCRDVACNDSPADECKDSTTLLVYKSAGTCNPDTGRCEYDSNEQNCEHGCGAGRCLDEDKCQSVVCDDPPDNACRPGDDNTLFVYEAVGDCNPDTGECEYDFSERHCDNGCENGICKDQDLCQGVVCDDPPANTCKDEYTLVEYEETGICESTTGRCNYDSLERSCEYGCAAGRCLDGKVAWGYIGIIESSDIPCYSVYEEWCSPVRAYFATDTNHTLVLPHHLDSICTKVEKQARGSCVLYTNCDKEGRGGRLSCAGGCDPDQECVGYYCLDLPPHWDVGEISMEGLKFPASMNPDEYDRYEISEPPNDLFDSGAPITVETSGGELGPFSLSAQGVPALEIESSVVLLETGKPAVIKWTSADSNAHVQVVLYSGWHFPLTPSAAIVCEVSDDVGQIEVPADFVVHFKEFFLFVRYSRITRFTRQVITPYQKEIELFVGSARLLTINNP